MSSQDHDLPVIAAAEADATCDPRPRWSALVKWMLTLIGIAQVVTLSVVAIQAVSLIDHDGIAYIRIATYYFHRQWHLAVSGYWGPLFSWLMLPLIAGVGLVFLRTIRVPPLMVVLCAGNVAVMSISLSANNETPDLLLCAITVVALSILIT